MLECDISTLTQSIMWDGMPGSTVVPQRAHKLSHGCPSSLVDNMLITLLLWSCNAVVWCPQALYARGFLPTMKFQLSQLP